MAVTPGSLFLWQIAPGPQVRPFPMDGRIVLALIWSPSAPPRGNDLAARIMARPSTLQVLHPKAHPLALLSKAVSEIHPYAKADH